MTTTVRRIAIPVERDRTVDGLRAVAMLGVVLGHWLVTGLVAGPGGGLRQRSPLSAMPVFTPVSWVLQTLGLFFFAAGFAAGTSLDRWLGAGRPALGWLAARGRRLLPPVAVFLGGWLLVRAVLSRAGLNPATVHTMGRLVISPLWFVLVLALLLPLTRFGRRPAVVLIPLAGVAVVDWARPCGLAYLNAVTAWSVPYLLGVAATRAGFDRRRWGVVLASVGGAGAVLLVAGAHYPASMVGVPGDGRSNLDPPSLAAVALALLQVGLALRCWDRLARLLRRPAWWAVVTALNVAGMTVFLLHQSALLVVALVGHAVLGDPAGLIGPPSGAGWLAHRLLWLPVCAAVLAAGVLLARAAGVALATASGIALTRVISPKGRARSSPPRW